MLGHCLPCFHNINPTLCLDASCFLTCSRQVSPAWLYGQVLVYLVTCVVLVGPRGGGPRVVVSTAAFHARVRGTVPGLGGLKETKLFLPHPLLKVSIVGSLRDREVACSASDHQGSNFESCVWRTVSSQSSHHPQEVLLAQFSLYVHKGGLKPDSFHFIWSALASCMPGCAARRCRWVKNPTLIFDVLLINSNYDEKIVYPIIFKFYTTSFFTYNPRGI